MHGALKKAAVKRLADLRSDIFKAFEISLKQQLSQHPSEAEIGIFRELLETSWAPLNINIHSRKHARQELGLTWQVHAQAFLILLKYQEEEISQGSSDETESPRFRLCRQSNEIFSFLTLRLSVLIANSPPKVFANYGNWLQTYRLMPLMISQYRSAHPRWVDQYGRANINKPLFALP